MLTQRLQLIAVLFSLSTAAVVACSSPPPKKATPTAPADAKKGDDDDSSSQSSQQTSTPAATPAPVVLPDAGRTLPDAGLLKPPPDAVKPPAPTTRFCMSLSQCCGTLPDLFQQLACGGTSVMGNEDACGIELAVCQGGGIDTTGLGDLFGQNNPQCNSLAKCCDTISTQGYTETASDCSSWVQIQDEASCQSQLQSYQAYFSCQ